MLDLRRLHMLAEFARQGGIARTAQALGYTPSAVSQQLAALERETGTALLDRTARSAALTDAGRRLAERAESILAMVESAEAELSAQRGVPEGRVVVSAFPTAAVAFSAALAQGLSEYPQLSLVLRQTGHGEALRQVQAGEVDIAIVDDWTGRLDRQAPQSLSLFPLRHDPLVLALPPGHRLADPACPVDLRQLRDEIWIAAPESEPSRQAVDRLLDEVGGARPRPWEFEGLHTIVSLVARGLGIAVVPELALGDAGVVVRELPVPAAREIYAAIRTAGERRPAIATTVRALRSAAIPARS